MNPVPSRSFLPLGVIFPIRRSNKNLWIESHKANEMQFQDATRLTVHKLRYFMEIGLWVQRSWTYKEEEEEGGRSNLPFGEVRVVLGSLIVFAFQSGRRSSGNGGFVAVRHCCFVAVVCCYLIVTVLKEPADFEWKLNCQLKDRLRLLCQFQISTVRFCSWPNCSLEIGLKPRARPWSLSQV